jgi:hypothetical protein
MSTSTVATAPGSAPAPADAAPARKKKLVRVRKDRRDREDEPDGPNNPAAAAPLPQTSYVSAARAASPLYLALVLLRLALAFSAGVVDDAESLDGVASLARLILPGMAGASDVSTVYASLPAGMTAAANAPANVTRSIVGAVVTSGIPYMSIAAACSQIPAVDAMLCAPKNIGYLAVFAPRVWMWVLSLVGDALLVRTFAVYESDVAPHALLAYATTWVVLGVSTRASNFALEAICLLGLLAGCFGWGWKNPRPIFWFSATFLALGIWLRPVFAVFVCTPLIYLVSLWGKPGVDPLHYIRAALEGSVIFGMWATLCVSVDSVFYGSFKLRFGETVITSFDMFVRFAAARMSGAPDVGPFSYKGYLIYTPLNAAAGLFTRAFWAELLRNTSPGQIFIHLPIILGPLMYFLGRESIEGMKIAIKELMVEMKGVDSKKKRKSSSKKSTGMTKEREEEMLVYFDTIQTSLLLGLLLEVMQAHDRIGVLSLVSLNAPAVICIASYVFGPNAWPNARLVHFAYSAAMIFFYAVLHHSGVSRTLLTLGAGGIPIVLDNTNLVVYRSKIGAGGSTATLALGTNARNITVHDGGQNRLDLMTTLRELKSADGYKPDRLLVCAAGTVPMKNGEFELVDTLALGHMSLEDLPSNIDETFAKSKLHMYKFVGDEDEAIIRDNEEAEELEEEENANKRSRK